MSLPQPPQHCKTLYVICHGALGILQTDQNFILMIPDLGSTHSYRAGTWLAETTIEKGSLTVLENVTGGQGSVPNLLAAAPRPATAVQPPFATFILPRPIQVHQLFPVVLSKDSLTSPSGPNPLTGDLVVDFLPILEYRYEQMPRLGNIWPAPDDDPAGFAENPLTLHIYAEDEVPLDDGHSEAAFNLTCQLLGLNIALSVRGAGVLPDVAPGPRASVPVIPPGLENRCFEFQPLDVRRTDLLEIAKAKQTGGAIPDPWASLPCNDLTVLGRIFFGLIREHIDIGNASCLSVSVGADG